LIIRVEQLHQNGVQTMGDLWNAQVQQWKRWFEVRHIYELEEGESCIWEGIIEKLFER
jgi:nucleotidyltransferase/DNA polymerase involved in DNA repair